MRDHPTGNWNLQSPLAIWQLLLKPVLIFKTIGTKPYFGPLSMKSLADSAEKTVNENGNS
jgi:hypothetical protein